MPDDLQEVEDQILAKLSKMKHYANGNCPDECHTCPYHNECLDEYEDKDNNGLTIAAVIAACL